MPVYEGRENSAGTRCWREASTYRAGEFQSLLGMILTVIIALEFKAFASRGAERHESIVQVRTVVFLMMLAVLRKLIIVDLDTTSTTFGPSVAILALAIVYWLVRDRETRFGSLSAHCAIPALRPAPRYALRGTRSRLLKRPCLAQGMAGCALMAFW